MLCRLKNPRRRVAGQRQTTVDQQKAVSTSARHLGKVLHRLTLATFHPRSETSPRSSPMSASGPAALPISSPDFLVVGSGPTSNSTAGGPPNRRSASPGPGSTRPSPKGTPFSLLERRALAGPRRKALFRLRSTRKPSRRKEKKLWLRRVYLKNSFTGACPVPVAEVALGTCISIRRLESRLTGGQPAKDQLAKSQLAKTQLNKAEGPQKASPARVGSSTMARR